MRYERLFAELEKANKKTGRSKTARKAAVAAAYRGDAKKASQVRYEAALRRAASGRGSAWYAEFTALQLSSASRTERKPKKTKKGK